MDALAAYDDSGDDSSIESAADPQPDYDDQDGVEAVIESEVSVDEDSGDEFGPKPAMRLESSVSTGNTDKVLMPPPTMMMSMKKPADKADSEQMAATSKSKPTISEDFLERLARSRKIPIACEISLGGHEKAVSCLSVESSGNRVVTGSLDYYIKIFDYGGMDSRHRAFKSSEPLEGHPVNAIDHAPNGEKFIISNGSNQPQVFDRDGNMIIQFVKGDMYIRDLTHTKGHVMEVTSVSWHPQEKNLIVTGSLDASIRIWDLTHEALFGQLINKLVIKFKNPTNNQRCGVTASCFNRQTGNLIIAGNQIGMIQIFAFNPTNFMKKVYTKPDYYLYTPDECQNHAVQSLVVSTDNEYLAARFDHGIILIYRLKSMVSSNYTSSSSSKNSQVNAPIAMIDGMMNLYPSANTTFSPDSTVLCCLANNITTTSNEGANTNNETVKARLYFFDLKPIFNRLTTSTTTASTTATKLVHLTAEDSFINIVVDSGSKVHGIYVVWNINTNHIYCSLSSGDVKVLYDPTMSKKGALLSSSRAPRREKDPSDFGIVGEIVAPLLEAEERQKQKKRKRQEVLEEQQHQEKMKKHIPEKSSTGQGPGSRPNTSFFFTQYVLSTSGEASSAATGKEDPREALLKLDAATKENPMFFAKAYQKTQPKNLLAEKTFEQEVEDFHKKNKK